MFTGGGVAPLPIDYKDHVMIECYNRIRGSSECCRTPDMKHSVRDINSLLDKLKAFVDNGGSVPVPIPEDIDHTSKEVEITTDIVAGENPQDGHEISVLYNNRTNVDYTVTIPGEKYLTPDGKDIIVIVPVGGYAEASFLNVGGVIYARGC